MENLNTLLPSWRTLLLWVGIFLFVTFLVFGASLGYGFLMLDDPYLVYNNLAIRGPTWENLRVAFTTFDPELYIPLTIVSYQFNYLLGGLEPGIYHCTNLILHAGNGLLVSILVFMLIVKWKQKSQIPMTNDQNARSKKLDIGIWPALPKLASEGGSLVISFLCGLLFLVHPLNTEAVVWISARKDLLSTFFYLISVIAYLQYRATQGGRWGGLTVRGLRWAIEELRPPTHGRDGQATPHVASRLRMLIAYWGSVFAFLLAALSKATVLTLPLALILLTVLRSGRQEKSQIPMTNDQKRNWTLGFGHWSFYFPYLLTSVIFIVIAIAAKSRVIESSTLLETILMAGKSTVFYLQKFLVPTGLTALYPYQKPITISSPDFWIPWAILIVIGIGALLSLKRTKWILICTVLFTLTLAPSYLNFHKGTVTFFAVDRYVYLPMVWLIVLLGYGLLAMSNWQLADRKKLIATSQLPIALLMILILLIFAVLSKKQTHYWSSNHILFSRALALYPESVPARVSLSVIYREEGRLDMERAVVEKGLSYVEDAALYVGIGSVAAREGNLEEAEENYRKAMALDPRNPEPFFYLGSLDEQRGNTEAAIEKYRHATTLDPSYVAAYNNLGAIHLDRGENPQAEAMFRKAVEWNRNFMEGHYNLFQVLEIQNRQDEAFAHLLKAYALYPDSSDIVTAVAYRLHLRERTEEALAAIDHLLAVDPENAAGKRLKEYILSESSSSSTTAAERREERLRERLAR